MKLTKSKENELALKTFIQQHPNAETLTGEFYLFAERAIKERREVINDAEVELLTNTEDESLKKSVGSLIAAKLKTRMNNYPRQCRVSEEFLKDHNALYVWLISNLTCSSPNVPDVMLALRFTKDAKLFSSVMRMVRASQI